MSLLLISHIFHKRKEGGNVNIQGQHYLDHHMLQPISSFPFSFLMIMSLLSFSQIRHFGSYFNQLINDIILMEIFITCKVFIFYMGWGGGDSGIDEETRHLRSISTSVSSSETVEKSLSTPYNKFPWSWTPAISEFGSTMFWTTLFLIIRTNEFELVFVTNFNASMHPCLTHYFL